MPAPGQFDNLKYEPRVVIAPHPKRPAFAPHRPLCAPFRGWVESQPQRGDFGLFRPFSGEPARTKEEAG